MSGQPAVVEPDPLRGLRLDSLLEGAARLRPQAMAICEAGDGRRLSYDELAQDVRRFAARMVATGLKPGETILLLSGYRASGLVALMAGVAAGINVVLAPADIRPDRLALLAGQTGAALLLCGDNFGGMDLLGKGFAAAAMMDTIRIVGSLDSAMEDAADFSPAALGEEAAPALPAPTHAAHIITTVLRDGRMQPVRHLQATLVAAALDVVARAGLSASQPILSTIAPNSLAGLVAGPFAALMSGATLHMHGLFDARILMNQIAQNPGARLAVPATLLRNLAHAGLLQPGALGGIMALSRWQDNGSDFAPLPPVASAIELTDLHGFGELALVAEKRGLDGTAGKLFEQPHLIEIDGQSILAVDARETGGNRRRFYGAAVTQTGE